MAAQVFEYDPPERFVAGTVGEPGQRTFFLQARTGARVTSVALEKEQVAVLAERVDELLDEVLRRSGGTAHVPAVMPPEMVDLEPLEQPIEEEFRVGTMSLTWDADDERLVIEARQVDPSGASETSTSDDEEADADDSDSSDLDVLRIRITGAEGRAFVQRAQALVSAGRPPCPFCGLPLDAEGHVCPRQNGYRRR